MPRSYRKGARADSEASTRRRILDAAAAALNDGDGFGVREVAARGGVTVQTVYAHFGSKAGLTSAVIRDVSESAGLFAGFQRVFALSEGSAQLLAMVEVTWSFWHSAWPFVRFSLVERRRDAEYAAQIAELDTSRLEHLRRICRQAAADGTLRPGLAPDQAAALVFAITTPNVYEELAGLRRLPWRRSLELIKETVERAVLAE